METRNELAENFTKVLEKLNMKATADTFRQEFSSKNIKINK